MQTKKPNRPQEPLGNVWHRPTNGQKPFFALEGKNKPGGLVTQIYDLDAYHLDTDGQ